MNFIIEDLFADLFMMKSTRVAYLIRGFNLISKLIDTGRKKQEIFNTARLNIICNPSCMIMSGYV